MTIEVIVLAAGRGTRMASSRPKVLHTLGGRSLLDHVLNTAQALDPSQIHVVVGPENESLAEAQTRAALIWHIQKERLGTGHAVEVAMCAVHEPATVLVLYADMPLVRVDTLRALCAQAQDDRVVMLTARPDVVDGFGRIIRDKTGAVTGIVEEADATAKQRAIGEVNTGILVAPARRLGRWLAQVENGNEQGERYLTDVVAMAVADEVDVVAHAVADLDESLGVNDKAQLAAAERALQRRQAHQLMQAGLTLRDPARFDLRGQVVFGSDCVIDINVVLGGCVELGDRVTIGPNCQVSNARIEDDVVVHSNCVIDDAKVGAGARIGPFARLRPGAELAANVHIGNFVEIKKSQIGADTKVNHLAYIGDSDIGDAVNIGAGVITCNYDGVGKYKTVVGDGAFIGSNTQLVAPVTIGAGATIGAGSTIRQDAPSGKLTLTPGRQKTVSRWRRRRDDSQ